MEESWWVQLTKTKLGRRWDYLYTQKDNQDVDNEGLPGRKQN